MANYYTKLSEAYVIPMDAAVWLLGLEQRLIDTDGELDCEYDPRDAVLRELFGADLRPPGCPFNYHRPTSTLTICSDETADVEVVVTLLQAMLRKFEIDEPLTLQWSYDCSKPRLDAYGGGAAIVTKDEIKQMHTAQWLGDQLVLLADPDNPA